MMKLTKYSLVLLLAMALGLRADEATNKSTNAHPAKKKEASGKDNGKKDESSSSKKDEENKFATIPDAARKAMRITNTVTIAGEKVRYVAETGMLPLLKVDGTSRASVFYIAYTKQGETNAAK